MIDVPVVVRAQELLAIHEGIQEREARRDKMSSLPEYELFAIRYATREARRADHFIGGDPHDGPMPMDYFVWVAKGAERTSSSTAASRRRRPRSASARSCAIRSMR